ncbi:MAG: hypothetical protein LAP39_30045 [Acidobacteriia bacterium]|nr:hypothetical protein [Terriglobia bacterium]
MVTAKLKKLNRIAIAGLGGTGSYILDFVAKTPVWEIHLYDGDDYLQHNAFRAPGAPSLAELQEQTKKATRFKNIYSKMHSGIVDHPVYIDENRDRLGIGTREQRAFLAHVVIAKVNAGRLHAGSSGVSRFAGPLIRVTTGFRGRTGRNRGARRELSGTSGDRRDRRHSPAPLNTSL